MEFKVIRVCGFCGRRFGYEAVEREQWTTVLRRFRCSACTAENRTTPQDMTPAQAARLRRWIGQPPDTAA